VLVLLRECFQAFLAKASPEQYGQVIPQVRKELMEMATPP
jgi:hypothetical protein